MAEENKQELAAKPSGSSTALEPRKAGRPSSFIPEYHIPKVKELTEKSQRPPSIAKIARIFGIDRRTLYRWSKESPELEYELNVCKTAGEDYLIDTLWDIGEGELKGNPTALAMIGNNVYGWRGENTGGGNTYNIQNNVSLTYNQVNEEIQKYLDKMGVKNLKEFQDNIIDVDYTEVPEN